MAAFEYLQALPRERTYLLPALHLLQEHEGYLSAEGLAAVSLDAHGYPQRSSGSSALAGCRQNASRNRIRQLPKG